MYNKKVYKQTWKIKKSDQFLERLIPPCRFFLAPRFSGWIPIWSMDAIPHKPSYSASFSPLIFLLHYPFLISIYLWLNMYFSKDTDAVPTFKFPGSTGAGPRQETMSDFIFCGSKITADGDCSHEIKRCLLLGRKVMTNLDSIFKSRDITLPTKVRLVKDMVFPVVIYGCESWTVKKAEH